MPVTASRDDEQRKVTVTVTDPWSVEEIAVIMDRQVADRSWSYGVLYDLRNSGWIPAEPDILWLVKRGQQQSARHGTRGPVAVLIGERVDAPALETYAAYSATHAKTLIEVFTDADEANRWLAERQG